MDADIEVEWRVPRNGDRFLLQTARGTITMVSADQPAIGKMTRSSWSSGPRWVIVDVQ